MNTNLDPGKITRLLTLSARQLDQNTLSALSIARQKALERQSARSPFFALSTGHGTHRLLPNIAHPWVIAGVLAAVLVLGTGYWQHIQEQQIDDTDLAILTDDTPIDVFVD